MTKIPKLSLAFVLMACSSMMLSTAHAKPGALWEYIPAPAMGGFKIDFGTGKIITYSTTSPGLARVSDAVGVWSYAGANPPGSQSPAAIQSLVKTQFGLPASGAGSLKLASSVDSLTSAKTGNFTVASSFDYLAVHYGNGELLFHWAKPLAANTVFSFGNLPNGVSNFRAYRATPAALPPVAAVPEPATYGMMLAGLGLLGFVARRRKPA